MFGQDDEVGEIMQKGSHKTRAFFINANGLRGFLVYSIGRKLEKAQERGELVKETEHIEVKIESLVEYLKQLDTNKEGLDYLARWYPNLYVFVMEKRGMKQQMKQYMEKCESYENDYAKFSLYVHGYWLPHLR